MLAAQQISRETFWQISHVGEIAFSGLAAVSIAIFLYRVYQRFTRYPEGDTDRIERFDDIARRIGRATRTLITNRNLRDGNLVAGIMHAFIVWGFIILLIGTTILAPSTWTSIAP